MRDLDVVDVGICGVEEHTDNLVSRERGAGGLAERYVTAVAARPLRTGWKSARRG